MCYIERVQPTNTFARSMSSSLHPARRREFVFGFVAGIFAAAFIVIHSNDRVPSTPRGAADLSRQVVRHGAGGAVTGFPPGAGEAFRD
jgi:hypothetical protein